MLVQESSIADEEVKMGFTLAAQAGIAPEPGDLESGVVSAETLLAGRLYK